MTIRAVLIGIALAVFLCGFSFFNDYVIKATFTVANHMPVAIYGGLIVFAVAIHPLMMRFARRFAFSGPEVAVILTLGFSVCFIPGAGLLRSFAAQVVLPHHYELTEPGWRESGVVQMAPPSLLADVSDPQARVVEGFLQGKAPGDDFGWSSIPWDNLTGVIGTWGFGILLMTGALLGLALVVHKQWSDHEQLPYPLAAVANSILPSGGELFSGVLRSKLFWYGMVPVAIAHVVNFSHEQFNTMLQIPRFVGLRDLTLFLPAELRDPGYRFGYLNFNIMFIVIGIAYFVPKDVSLSVGVAQVFHDSLIAALAAYGVSLAAGNSGGWNAGNLFQFGAYFGLFLSILYTGRFYYASVAKRAIGLRVKSDATDEAIWGARIFMVLITLFGAWLVSLGVDWQLAVLYTGIVLIIQVVMSRILVETGLFFIQPVLYPAAILTAFFGMQAIGPEMFLIMTLVSSVFVFDPRQTFMPYIVNAFKFLRFEKVAAGRLFAPCLIAIALAFLAGVAFNYYFQYRDGPAVLDTWGSGTPVRKPYAETLKVQRHLEGQGFVEESLALEGFERFAHTSPMVPSMVGFGLGIGIVLLFTFCRLRFVGWPIHPVIFAVWTGYATRVITMCFLIGWLIKTLVLKFGGVKLYDELKPLMIGLMAGDIMGAFLNMGFGITYYLTTGDQPANYKVIP